MRFFSLFALACLLGCGANKLTVQDETEEAQRVAAEGLCISTYAPDAAKIDACRAGVKAAWAAKWNQRFDGGFEP